MKTRQAILKDIVQDMIYEKQKMKAIYNFKQSKDYEKLDGTARTYLDLELDARNDLLKQLKNRADTIIDIWREKYKDD